MSAEVSAGTARSTCIEALSFRHRSEVEIKPSLPGNDLSRYKGHGFSAAQFLPLIAG